MSKQHTCVNTANIVDGLTSQCEACVEAPRCEHGWPLPGHSFVAKCQACRIAVLEKAAMAARVVVDSFARDEWSTADEELDAALRKAGF
jgi:hypothetical protein